jgi:hypothetical protein
MNATSAHKSFRPSFLGSRPPSGSKFNFRIQARLLTVLLWLVFCLGILLQAFSSHLEIKHNAFVMPPVKANSGVAMNPSEVVGRERRVQALSGLLVLGGALGLAVRYRRSLSESIFGFRKCAPNPSGKA